MTETPDDGYRRGRMIAAAVTVVLLAAGAAALFIGLNSSDSSGGVSDAATPSQTQPSAPGGPATKASKDGPTDDFGPVLSGSPPVALDIGGIDVHSSNIVGLTVEADGTIEVPKDADNPGWFTPGPSPGQFGPAIIAGHVDSDTGPAVFADLGEMQTNDRIKVTRKDGTSAQFVVDRISVFDKENFPTHKVYGNTTNRAELRLITCTGDYLPTTGYASNVVVFAHLVA